MSNKLYLGSGWTKSGKYGDFSNIQIDLNKLAENPNCIQKVGDRKFLKLEKNEHLVRLHIGLEDPKDLINDLKKSLKYIR